MFFDIEPFFAAADLRHGLAGGASMGQGSKRSSGGGGGAAGGGGMEGKRTRTHPQNLSPSSVSPLSLSRGALFVFFRRERARSINKELSEASSRVASNRVYLCRGFVLARVVEAVTTPGLWGCSFGIWDV